MFVFSFAFAFDAGLYYLFIMCGIDGIHSSTRIRTPRWLVVQSHYMKFGWILLGVAVIGPQEIKGFLTNIFQK